jgi:hypothetical protein
MKKLITILAICLGCNMALSAQNIWKPIGAPGYVLAVAPNGYLYSTSFEMGCLCRSTDEGLTWEPVFSNETIYSGTQMTVSDQGRVFLIPPYYSQVYYSDNNGDTWHITPMFPTCLVDGMYAVSNDTLFIWGTNEYGNESLHFTLDGGSTWSSADITPMSQTHHIGDVIANEEGDVFVSFWSNNAQNDGIYHCNYTDAEYWEWELAAFPNISVRDMEFDAEGNVMAVANAGEYIGFQQVPGYYLAGSMAASIAVADNGAVYICRQHDNHSVLAYSNDQGVHFHEIGEPLTATGGTLFRGRDNHLYYFANNSHWKSMDEAGNIDTNFSTFAPQGAEWYFNLSSYMGSDVSYYRMEVIGDTLIQGHQCTVISRQFLGDADYQYVYEEDRKVYWYNPTLDAFTTLYDFDAEVGESWICEVGDCSYEIRVRSVDDILFEGHTYRVQNVAPVNGEYFYYSEGRIIDGIGSVEGLFPYPSICEGAVYEGPYPDFLRCYLVNGETIYHQGNYACDAVYPFNTTCWDGTVAEAYEGGDGTEENPFQIATPQQLALLAQQTNEGEGTAHYILVDDICLNDEGGTLEWPVIGLDASPAQPQPTYFRGVFDGNEHVIKGMYISEYHISSGLFGDTKNAVIKNLTVEDSRIVAGNGMGIIAGEARNTDFINCNVIECEMITTVRSGGQGGIVGNVFAYDNEMDTLFIKDCTSNIRFSTDGSYYSCGGIVGYACSQRCVLVIENCMNYSNVIGIEDTGGILGTGGVIGNDESSAFVVRECKNYGEITLGRYSGGIVGYCWDIEVSRCFNWGDVTANYNAGGIIGINMDGIVIECANMGNMSSISTSGAEVGGLVGEHSGGVVANCYNRGEVSAVYDDPNRANEALGGIVGLSTGSIYNVYNAGTIVGPELPSSFDTMSYGAIIGHTTEEGKYMNCYWLEQDDLPACGNANLPDLPGSSAFNEGEAFNEWMLNDPQYGTDYLLDALNFGAPAVLDSVPSYPNLCVWQKDEYGVNGGLPIFDFQEVPLFPFFGSEWYYEIQNGDGSVTYQHLEYAGDTTINHKDVKIVIRTNTLYDKSDNTVVTHEYVYEEEGIVYWWNRDLHQFTTLYNLVAEVGDTWQIRVGMQSLTMHVDAVDSLDYNGRTFRVMHVSDVYNLFSGDIVCGIGHQTSFFPERLMRNGEGLRVDGLRCYWVEDKLVFKNGEKDCDAIFSEIHGIDEPTYEHVVAQFDLYPNPTNGVLFVETRLIASLQGQTYRVTNLTGQTVLTGSLNAETQQIDVSGLPEGMYFITVSGETRKFIVW